MQAIMRGKLAHGSGQVLQKCCPYVHTHAQYCPARSAFQVAVFGCVHDMTCLISPCWLWAAGTWLGAAGLTAGRGGGYIGSDRPAVLRRARHLACCVFVYCSLLPL